MTPDCGTITVEMGSASLGDKVLELANKYERIMGKPDSITLRKYEEK